MSDPMPEGTVTPLRLAELVLPDFHPAAPGTDVIYGFLVRDGGSCILVDTGVGKGSRLIDRLYQPRRVELPEALAEAGARPEEITAIVSSHLHFDHCGNNSLFPGVPIYAQRAELDAAREPHYTVREWVDFPGAHYVPVDGARVLSSRLELRPTPGHTPGHQSLLVHSASGPEVVVAQAAYTAAEFQLSADLASDGADALASRLESHLGANASWSRDSYLESLAEIHRVRPRRAYFSHDPTVWTRGD